jgi:membrane protease YdiL (CAAX protease family)
MATARRTEDGVPDRGAAPSLGLVLAGVALAVAFQPWTDQPQFLPVPAVPGSALGAGLAAIALLAFAARRYGLLDRTVTAPVAGVASLSVAVLALARLMTPALGEGSAPTLGHATLLSFPGVGFEFILTYLTVAALAGIAGAVVALGDWYGVADDALWRKVRALGMALVIGFLAFLLSQVVALVPALLVRPFGQTLAVAALTIFSGVGLVLSMYVYLRTRDLEWSYVDVDWPDLQAVAYGIVGLIVLYGSAIAVTFLFRSLGLPSATSSIEELARQMDDPVFLLVLVPLSWIVIGPGEELVYRNIVQKYLYEAFSGWAAVGFASVVFAVVHYQQYADPNPIALLNTLAVVFFLSVILGYTYYKTENLIVPIFIHGTFNAIQFLALYVRLTTDSGAQPPF